jgi:hypothetical protein
MKGIVPVYGVISHLSFVICYFGFSASASCLLYATVWFMIADWGCMHFLPRVSEFLYLKSLGTIWPGKNFAEDYLVC